MRRRNYFVGRFPRVVCSSQPQANFRYAFSVFEFASEKSAFIRVHPWLNSLQHLTARKDSMMQKRKLGKGDLEVSRGRGTGFDHKLKITGEVFYVLACDS